MAKQFNILATDVDLQALEKILRDSKSIELLSDIATEDLAELIPLDSLSIPILNSGKTSLFCYLAPSTLPKKIFIERESPVKVHIDGQASHLIEFWRPYYNGHIMRTGRLYYQDRLVVDKVFVAKDPAFCDWAKSVMNRIRKIFQRDPIIGAYVGEDARIAIASGRVTIEEIL